MVNKKEIENCPNCDSDNCIYKKKSGYMVMLSFLLLGLPLPFFKKKKYCYDCGTEW